MRLAQKSWNSHLFQLFIPLFSLAKCVQQHPYHTLPVLLTQSLLHADQPGGSANRQQNIEVRTKFK